MENMKQIKTQIQVTHSLITGEVLELEKKALNHECVQEMAADLGDKIQEEIGRIREIMTNLRIANKLKDVSYIDSFDSDYSNKLSWIDYCVLI